MTVNGKLVVPEMCIDPNKPSKVSEMDIVDPSVDITDSVLLWSIAPARIISVPY